MDKPHDYAIQKKTNTVARSSSFCFQIDRRVSTGAWTYQVVKDIPLVHMNGDESLKLGPLHFVQVLGSLVNQRVQQV